jgi:hypothetical protein
MGERDDDIRLSYVVYERLDRVDRRVLALVRPASASVAVLNISPLGHVKKARKRNFSLRSQAPSKTKTTSTADFRLPSSLPSAESKALVASCSIVLSHILEDAQFLMQFMA